MSATGVEFSAFGEDSISLSLDFQMVPDGKGGSECQIKTVTVRNDVAAGLSADVTTGTVGVGASVSAMSEMPLFQKILPNSAGLNFIRGRACLFVDNGELDIGRWDALVGRNDGKDFADICRERNKTDSELAKYVDGKMGG